MQIADSILNNIKTECVVESIKPLIIRFKFIDVPNDISLSQLISDRCIECRVMNEVIDTCTHTEGLGNEIFTAIHILEKIHFQIDYLNINSKKMQARYNSFVKSIQDNLDNMREDERRRNMVSEFLNENEIQIPGMIPPHIKVFKIDL